MKKHKEMERYFAYTLHVNLEKLSVLNAHQNSNGIFDSKQTETSLMLAMNSNISPVSKALLRKSAQLS